MRRNVRRRWLRRTRRNRRNWKSHEMTGRTSFHNKIPTFSTNKADYMNAAMFLFWPRRWSKHRNTYPPLTRCIKGCLGYGRGHVDATMQQPNRDAVNVRMKDGTIYGISTYHLEKDHKS